MQQNVQINVTNNDVVTFGGTMNTKDNFGGGTLNASLRRIVSPESHLEVNHSLLEITLISISNTFQC